MEDKIIEFTRDYYRYYLSPSDKFCIERYVDYDEEIGEHSIGEILSADDPWAKLDELVDSGLDDTWYYESEFWSELGSFCEKNSYDYEAAKDVVYDNFCWVYPDKFLNPKFDAVIRVNTGDWNYEWVRHNVLNYYKDDKRLPKDAGLYWLAEQQDKLGLLQNAIKDPDRYYKDESPENKFVASSIRELVNLPGPFGSLTFLVKMNLFDAIKIMVAVRSKTRKEEYDPRRMKYLPLGYIVLGKDTHCGLYDACEGGGSTLEIELEKDVKLPIHFIYDIDTDARVQQVYGLTGKCWQDSVIEVHVREKKSS